MKKLDAALGVVWGEDAAQAASRLALTCGEWSAWSGGQGFEVCDDLGHPIILFGAAAQVQLVREGSTLQGVILTYRDCARTWIALRERIRRALDLGGSSGPDLYEIGPDGALVQFDRNRQGDRCTLTLASPAFGKAYAAHLLGQGIGELGRSLRPS